MTRQRKPIARSTVPIPRRRKKPRQVSVVRDRKYLDWLHDRRCVACVKMNRSLSEEWFVCGRLADPAHGPPNGLGSKGPDDGAIPLGRKHHEEQTRIGWVEFEDKYMFYREAEAKAHYAAFKLVGAET